MKIEGMDYSPEGIEWIRDELAKLRDDSCDEDVTRTFVFTAAIALLAHLISLLPDDDRLSDETYDQADGHA